MLRRRAPLRKRVAFVAAEENLVGWAKAHFAPCPPLSRIPGAGTVGTLRFAHPHMRPFCIQASRPGLGCDFLHSVERRRAEPCVAQRAAAAVGALRNWLPAIYAAAHCITSYPVGRLQPGTHIPHVCGGGDHGDETHLRSGLLIWPKGGTVIIHSARTAADAATLTRCLKRLRLRGLEQGSFGDQAGCEVAPERHHQLARQRHDGDALVALAGIVVGAAAEPSGERTLRLMPQPQPGKFDGGAAGARIARLADALVAVNSAALPWTGRQPETARDLTPIAEVLL